MLTYTTQETQERFCVIRFQGAHRSGYIARDACTDHVAMFNASGIPDALQVRDGYVAFVGARVCCDTARDCGDVFKV
jgi:hypothetical protein